MKKRIGVWFVLLVMSVICTCMAVCAEASDASGAEEVKGAGFSVKNPDRWEGMNGTLLLLPVSEASIYEDPEVFCSSLVYIPATKEELNDEGNVAAIMGKMTEPGYVFTIQGDRESLVEVIKELEIVEPGDEETLEDSVVQIGEADGYQFFLFSSLNEDYAASLDEAYAQEYRNLPALIEKEMKQAAFSAPVDPTKALIGKTISFTSTDLDGNPVTSEELFQDNEITMLNLWGVWCINCVNEMEELAAIHTRLQEKGCGIVGIEMEKNPGDAIYEEARKLMEEKGTNYQSVLMPEDNEILRGVTSYPTTFFVDREGTILAKPIVGARVDAYEPTLESLLDGAPAPETEMEDTGSYTYRVFVTDEDGQGLEGAAVQFCDETACKFGTTDAEGCASFEVSEKKVYDVHILAAPEGYAFDEEEVFSTEDAPSDTTVVLKKAE